MKTIGKIAALAMTLSLAVVLSACGGNASSSASASASASAASTSAATSTSSSASASNASVSSSSASQATSYTNDYFGLDFVLPEGWSFVDAATLSKTNSVVSSLAQSDAVDMVAASSDGTTSVIVAVTEPGSETAGKTAEEFLKAQVAGMEAGLQGNYQFQTEDADITFDGMARKLPAAFTTITAGESTLVIGQAVAEKGGNYLDVVAIGVNETDVTDAFRAFKATSE